MANNKNITFDQLQTSLKKVKSAIDGKANTSHGNHVPTTGTADNATYLRNDNSWHKIVPSDIGAAPSVHGTHVTYSTTAPSTPGTASAGTADNVSRGDHVHPLQTTISGNAGSATKLANARNLTVGNTKKSFNGTADVSWSLSEIGAAASGHTHNCFAIKGENTISGIANDTTEKWKDQGNSVHWYTKPNQITGQPSQYGFLTNWATGGDVHQLWMIQSSGNMFHRGGNSTGWYGTWRTILDECNFTAYSPTLSGGGAMGTWGISVTGNASTATTLANSRTLTIGNTGKKFNGSSDTSWTLNEIGAAASNHTHGLINNNFTKEIENTTTDKGWSMISENYNGFLLTSVRTNANAPIWAVNNYSAGIAFGGSDTKGIMTVSYVNPFIKFAGGNGTKPTWYIGLTGASGKTYNMESIFGITNKTVSNNTVTLSIEKYQKTAITSNTTIKLPSVSSFTEIHLFFDWPTGVTITMPSVKWQEGVVYGPGHVHEFVFTYIDNSIGWLGGCIVYG